MINKNIIERRKILLIFFKYIFLSLIVKYKNKVKNKIKSIALILIDIDAAIKKPSIIFFL